MWTCSKREGDRREACERVPALCEDKTDDNGKEDDDSVRKDKRLGKVDSHV